MLDRQVLLAAMADRAAYERIGRNVKPSEFSPQVSFWWKLVVEYYAADKLAKRVDTMVIRQLGDSRIKNPKHRDGLLAVVDGNADDVSVPNIVAAVLSVKRYNASAEFASAAMSGDVEKAKKLLETVNELWQRDSLDQEERFYAESGEDIFKVVGTEKRIAISPAALNSKIGGGVLPGHHIHIFGRTEVGKSAFSINLASGFVRRGYPVLYVTNEDSANVTKSRFMCRILKSTWQEIESRKSASVKEFAKLGGEERLRVVHLQPGSVSSLRRDIDEFKPAVVVIDQIRNLSGPEEGMTQRLEANAIKFRNLISEHSLIGVSVTQAGDRSIRHNEDPPIWLSSGDVDSSRVGLPAQVDLMLGIGGNFEMMGRGQRAISLVKNKLASGPNSREGIIVQFDLARNLVT